MHSRIILTLFTAAVVIFTLGFRSLSSEAAASREPVATASADTTIAAALELAVGDSVTFKFTITNHTPKKVEVRFPTGQTHEFVVLDSVGREMWRWSEGRLFTQVLQNRLVASNRAITFEESFSAPLPAGTYTAVARLRSNNFPLEQRVEFVIPADID